MRLPSGAPRAKAHAADLVTDTDELIERTVRERLRLAFPRHTVIGEEFAPHEGALGAATWVVDPVDGTTNFAHGIGWSSFSLGLRDAAGPLVAVVADPWRDELFSAVRGGGARLNGTPIRASAATDLRGQVVMTEWAAHEPWPGMPEILAELSRRWCTVRIMGSTALSLAQVAAGRAAATLIGEFHAIDGEPAMLIGTEAGAVALDPRADASAPGSRRVEPAPGRPRHRCRADRPLAHRPPAPLTTGAPRRVTPRHPLRHDRRLARFSAVFSVVNRANRRS